jgi:hypothetical protein
MYCYPLVVLNDWILTRYYATKYTLLLPLMNEELETIKHKEADFVASLFVFYGLSLEEEIGRLFRF